MSGSATFSAHDGAVTLPDDRRPKALLQPHYDLIGRLYIVMRWPLCRLMQYMSNDFGINLSKQQWKRVLAWWKVARNKNAIAYAWILYYLEKPHVEGGLAHVMWRGALQSMDSVEKYIKKKQKSQDEPEPSKQQLRKVVEDALKRQEPPPDDIECVYVPGFLRQAESVHIMQPANTPQTIQWPAVHTESWSESLPALPSSSADSILDAMLAEGSIPWGQTLTLTLDEPTATTHDTPIYDEATMTVLMEGAGHEAMMPLPRALFEAVSAGWTTDSVTTPILGDNSTHHLPGFDCHAIWGEQKSSISLTTIFLDHCSKACIWRGQGNSEFAQAEVAVSLEVFRCMIDEEREVSITAVFLLVTMLGCYGQDHMAVSILRQARQICSCSLGPNLALALFIDFILVVKSLQDNCKEVSMYGPDELIDMLPVAIDGSKDALTIQYYLGWTYARYGPYDRAIRTLLDLVQEAETVLGRYHFLTISCLATLARAEFKVGNVNGSNARMMDATSRLDELCLRDYHPFRLELRTRHAGFLAKQKRLVDAEAMVREVMRERFAMLSVDNLCSQQSLQQLKGLLECQQREESMEAILSEEKRSSRNTQFWDDAWETADLSIQC